MNNILPNGTILPSGLLGHNPSDILSGFRKTFQNNSLKVGIIVQTYGIGEQGNISKLVPEYDVLTMEQTENKASTVSLYKNCIASSSLGSIADFFEMTFRKLEHQTTKGTVPSPSGQDGSIVLILCLNGMGDTGIIIGALSHPDRPTTIKGEGPHLEGEFNGVHIVVNEDGSTSLTFKGPTNNDGSPVNAPASDTELSVGSDGSYQVMHKTITQSFNINGQASLTAQKDISNTTNADFNVTAQKDIDLTATGDFNANMNNMMFLAQGSAQLQCKTLALNAESGVTMQGSQIQIQAESLAGIKAPSITLAGQVTLGGSGGQPILLLGTLMLGVGNLGGIVISTAISGYSTMVTAQ